MPDITALAIDLGGSHAACGVVKDGVIAATRTLQADGSKPLADLLPELADTLLQLLASAQIDKSDCSALVLGFCGIASTCGNRILDTNGKFEDAPAWIFLAGVNENLDFRSWSRTMRGWHCSANTLSAPLVAHKTQ